VGYSFRVNGTAPDGEAYGGDAGEVTVVGREATPRGQDVYFKHSAYYGGPREAKNFLVQGDLFQLHDGKTIGEYEPACSTYVDDNWSYTIFKLSYIGDFSGDLDLVVRCGSGDAVRLALGPADCDYYQVAAVTGVKTLDLRVAPSANGAVIKTLRRGEMFYLTGRVGYYWAPPREDLGDVIPFYEAIYGETEGWVASYRSVRIDVTTYKPFFETGGFAPLRHGRREE
jgi:hypothetical protein